MEVEVVGIEVSKNGEIEFTFVHAMEREAVGSRLDYPPAAAGRNHYA